MATITSGLKGTADLSTQRLKVDIADGIALLDPNENPFVLMSNQVGKSAAKQPKHSWLEDVIQPEVTTVSGTVTSGATEFAVNNVTYLTAGQIWQVYDSYELLKIVSTSTNGNTTVVRNFPLVAATSTGYNTALADGDYMTLIGNVNEEGATAPTAMHTVEVQLDNYTQIVRTPFDLTETELNSLMEGEEDLPYETKKKGIEHARKLEYVCWFGIPGASQTGSTLGKPERTAGGVWWYLKENAPSGNLANQAELTQAEFLTWIRNCFRYGSSRKVLFACPLIMSAIESWGLAKLQVTPMDRTLGLNPTIWQSPHGTIALQNTKILEGPAPGTAGGWGFLLDMESIKYTPLRNRDTVLLTNIQANDADRYTAEYKTEFTLEVKNAEKHGAIYNITSFAA